MLLRAARSRLLHRRSSPCWWAAAQAAFWCLCPACVSEPCWRSLPGITTLSYFIFFSFQQRIEIHKLRQGDNLILGFSIGGGIDQDPTQNPFSEDKTDKVRCSLLSVAALCRRLSRPSQLHSLASVCPLSSLTPKVTLLPHHLRTEFGGSSLFPFPLFPRCTTPF